LVADMNGSLDISLVIARLVSAGVLLAATATRAAELPTLAGPAMGTTYRVILAADLPGMSRGVVHREIEQELARIDRALSAWRPDSDVTRFNEAGPDEWVEVTDDLVAVVEIARRVHTRTDGLFDITVAPFDSGRPVGLGHVHVRTTPPALAKTQAGIRLDLGGIGPGYAVDCIGARLEALGSAGHLVELGGEVRAWGQRPDGTQWRVWIPAEDAVAGRPAGQTIDLAPGEALGTAACKPGRSPIDPRTGRLLTSGRLRATVRALTCAEADALAVATLLSGDAGDAVAAEDP
jgi:thiamine biosynthesis lipoprotein